MKSGYFKIEGGSSAKDIVERLSERGMTGVVDFFYSDRKQIGTAHL